MADPGGFRQAGCTRGVDEQRTVGSRYGGRLGLPKTCVRKSCLTEFYQIRSCALSVKRVVDIDKIAARLAVRPQPGFARKERPCISASLRELRRNDEVLGRHN